MLLALRYGSHFLAVAFTLYILLWGMVLARNGVESGAILIGASMITLAIYGSKS